MFEDDDAALKFTETHKLDEARLALLLKLDRRTDAVKFLISKGRTFEAHELLVQDFKNKDSVRSVTKYILSRLWDHLYLGVVPRNKKKKRIVDELMRLATMLNFALVSANDCDEVRITNFVLLPFIDQLLPDIDVSGHCVHGPINTSRARAKILPWRYKYRCSYPVLRPCI